MTPNLPIVGFDYETPLITEVVPHPHPVCLSLCGGADSLHIRDAFKAAAGTECWESEKVDLQADEWAIVVRGELGKLLFEMRQDAIWVAHNLCYEYGVTCENLVGWETLPDWVSGNFRDTMVREQLWAIAHGCMGKFTFEHRLRRKDFIGPYSLADIVQARFNVDLSADKKDPTSWRLRYHELVGVSIPRWPIKALAYSAMDSVWTRRAFLNQQNSDTLTQQGSIVQDDATHLIWDELRQTSAALCLEVIRSSGCSVDAERVELYAGEIREVAAQAAIIAQEGGWVKTTGCRGCQGKGRVGDVPNLRDCEMCDGGRDPNVREKPKSWSNTDTGVLKTWVDLAYNGDPPKTAKGGVSTSTDTLKYSGHPLLVEYAKGKAATAALTRQVPLLERAARVGKVRPWFIFLVRSGRTACRSPNMQNPDSRGYFRSCFTANPGNVVVSIDYSTLEMFSWAQNCLELYGVSTMAEWLNAGLDVHSVFGRHVLQTFYSEDITLEEYMVRLKAKEERVVKCRKFAKVPIFGCPGMLQKPTTLVDYALGMGVELSLYEAEQLIRLWNEVLLESREWLDDLKSRAPGWDTPWSMRQPVSNRIRGGCSSSSGANSYFQGRAADFCKEVMYKLIHACLVDKSSPLFGCSIWNFVHDEFMFEGPADTAHIWVPAAQEIMLSCTNRYFPDVDKHMRTEATVSVRWDKSADLHVLPDGKYLPWEFSDRQRGGPSGETLPMNWLTSCPEYIIEYLKETT